MSKQTTGDDVAETLFALLRALVPQIAYLQCQIVELQERRKLSAADQTVIQAKVGAAILSHLPDDNQLKKRFQKHMREQSRIRDAKRKKLA